MLNICVQIKKNCIEINIKIHSIFFVLFGTCNVHRFGLDKYHLPRRQASESARQMSQPGK